MELNNINYNDIITDISIKLMPGTIVSFIGPTGAGKSLLLKLINGDIKATSGSVKKSKQTKISMVNQQVEGEFFYETIEKELEAFLEKNNYPAEKFSTHINDSIKMVGLTKEYLKRDPLTLSSSEMRILMIAKAISINPNVLILDEPTIGMTLLEKKNLIKIIKTIKRRYKKTVIVASQDIEFVHLISEYIYVLNDGKIVLEGSKYDVFKEESKLNKIGIDCPKIIQFENNVLNNKKIRLGYRDEINDLIKDILRKK